MTERWRGTRAAGVLAAWLCWHPASDAQAQALTECRVPGMAHSVQCGVVQRPLDPARQKGILIDVHYVVVPAMARRKLPDPVFVLAGGPGQSAITLAGASMPMFSRLNNRRDIVFVDQRGTGRSAPLACEDPQRESLAVQADLERQFQQIAACRAKLQTLPYIKAPADLGFFTTTIAMQDLDAVRRQLGAERIDLIGASYGTRAALDYLRQFPEAVRRTVLDGVAPPDMVLPASFSTDGQAAFDALLASCESEAACARSYPALRADWHALLASLPKPVTAAHPLTGVPERFTLTRDMVLAAARGPLYGPALASALPAAITEAARGRYEGLMGLGALLGSGKGAQLAMGMHFSVICAEDGPLMDHAADAPGADFGDSNMRLYARVCADWPRGVVPQAYYTVPVSPSPVLLLSGGIDPATPPRHGGRIARALGPAAQHVVVPNAGHGVMAIGCMHDVVYRFIDAVDDKDATGVDAGCVKAIPRPPAFLPIAQADGAAR